MRELPPIRRELVDRVREEIDRGTYDNAERVELAVRNMITELDVVG